MHAWNQEFVASSTEGHRYETMADEIDRTLRFMKACGVDTEAEPRLHNVDFWTSHEALILGYEEALTRRDSLTGEWYDCSAHMLWVGERTRQLDGAHLAFLAGVGNPLGCKIGPDAHARRGRRDLRRARSRPDPRPAHADQPHGRRRRRASCCRRCCEAVRDSGHPVVWACDPMHANTFTAPSGRKTRHFDDVLAEIAGSSTPTRRSAPGPAASTSS